MRSQTLVGVGQTMAEIDAVDYIWCRKIFAISDVAAATTTGYQLAASPDRCLNFIINLLTYLFVCISWCTYIWRS